MSETTEKRAIPETGREMNWRVAIEVMGYPPRPTREGVMGDCWPSCYDVKWLHCGDGRGWEIPNEHLPDYSGTIAAAWSVMEKMRELGYVTSIELPSNIGGMLEGIPHGEWEPTATCRLMWPLKEQPLRRGLDHLPRHRSVLENAATAPLAICLAALKAVVVTPRDTSVRESS